MIVKACGDILEADAEALVNTVNCVGFMGRGIALQFRKKYPENFAAYEAACKRGEVKPGRMLIHDLGDLLAPRWIVNFPTKRHWKAKSRLADIDTGLAALIAEVRRLGIQSIALPPLGCGLGGLDWSDVRPRIEAAFAQLPDVQLFLYEPCGPPAAATMAKPAIVPAMTPGRAALLALMRRYLAGLIDPFVSLLEIQKLMYFLQAAGEPLRLNFNKAHYGPYADNLRHVLNMLEGHFTSGYGDGADDPTKAIEFVGDSWSVAEKFLADRDETQRRLARVKELIQGFESSYGMELLASVHWLAGQEAATAETATAKLHAWNDRKRMFPDRHVRIAWKALEHGGWFSA